MQYIILKTINHKILYYVNKSNTNLRLGFMKKYPSMTRFIQTFRSGVIFRCKEKLT